MSERAIFSNNETKQGNRSNLVENAFHYRDPLIDTAAKLWREAQAELSGNLSARGNIKQTLRRLSECGEHPAVNTPLPAVLKTLDNMDNMINRTDAGRATYRLPHVGLTYDNTDRPTAAKVPVGLTFSRTESSPTPVLHEILPFLRIDGTAYQIPRSVPGGLGDVCIPDGPKKPHGKPLAPRG